MPSRVQPQMGGVNEQSTQPGQGAQRKAPQGAQPSTGPFPPGPGVPPPAQPQGPFNPLPSPAATMVSQPQNPGLGGQPPGNAFGQMGLGQMGAGGGGQDIMAQIMAMLGKGGQGGGPQGY